MADPSPLYGSCACERNQYTILIPPTSASASRARVFLDNSAANRRSQASPLTAWLRIPLAWYHSSTHAHFSDETHPSIRKTYHTPAPSSQLGGTPTRRQFCGYCGTHLTAWNEGAVGEGEWEWLDVTLGSLLNESLERLEGLGIRGEEPEDEEEGEEEMGLDGANAVARAETRSSAMGHVGMPYFEEMVENSRLGQIRRQKGGHTSRDGRTTVEWEVVEVGGDSSVSMETVQESTSDGGSVKRQRLDA